MNSLFRFLVLWSFVLFICSSCTQKMQTKNISKNEQTFQGLLALGETNQFITCKDNQKLKVNAPSKQIAEAYLKTTRSSFNGDYIEASIIGSVKNNTITISKITNLKPKSRFSSCAKYNVWANGEKPFWDLQISEIENRATLKLLKEPTFVFDYVTPKMIGQAKVYYFLDQKHRLKVTIKEKPSVDAAGNHYQYTASIEFKGNEYHGTAKVK